MIKCVARGRNVRKRTGTIIPDTEEFLSERCFEVYQVSPRVCNHNSRSTRQESATDFQQSRAEGEKVSQAFSQANIAYFIKLHLKSQNWSLVFFLGSTIGWWKFAVLRN